MNHTSLSFTTLANFTTLYTTTGPTGQFYLFREIVNRHIGNGNPSTEIAHLTDLFVWLTSTGLDLPVNLYIMLLCTELGNNYSNLITTIVHTKTTAQFTPDIIIPMILAEMQCQGTSLANWIPADKAKMIKKASSQCCKIYCGSSHVIENCWKLMGKPVSGNQTNQHKQQ